MHLSNVLHFNYKCMNEVIKQLGRLIMRMMYLISSLSLNLPQPSCDNQRRQTITPQCPSIQPPPVHSHTAYSSQMHIIFTFGTYASKHKDKPTLATLTTFCLYPIPRSSCAGMFSSIREMISVAMASFNSSSCTQYILTYTVHSVSISLQ